MYPRLKWYRAIRDTSKELLPAPVACFIPANLQSGKRANGIVTPSNIINTLVDSFLKQTNLIIYGQGCSRRSQAFGQSSSIFPQPSATLNETSELLLVHVRRTLY